MKLPHVEVLVGQEMVRVDAIHDVRITEQKYYPWRNQYGGNGSNQLRDLQRIYGHENVQAMLPIAGCC